MSIHYIGVKQRFLSVVRLSDLWRIKMPLEEVTIKFNIVMESKDALFTELNRLIDGFQYSYDDENMIGSWEEIPKEDWS